MKFTPHDYQTFAIEHILRNDVSALFLDMGLGKTVITLTAIQRLLPQIHKVLIIAPLRVARDTWPAEIRKWDHLRDLSYAVAVGSECERLAALRTQADIRQLGERFHIREIACDRWNASMMVQELEDEGFTLIPFGQGFRDMSNPTKDLMRLVLEGSLRHDRNPVLRWNMDNVFVRTDPAGNIKIDKEKSTEKVDGAVALVMALDRALKSQGADSVYDSRGFLTLDW